MPTCRAGNERCFQIPTSEGFLLCFFEPSEEIKEKEIVKFISDGYLQRRKKYREKSSSLHQLRSRTAHLLCCIPNLCHSSAKAMSHSGQGNRYRNLGELNSNQQHIYDIYHTPALHFSAILCCPISKNRKKERRKEKNVKHKIHKKMEKNSDNKL